MRNSVKTICTLGFAPNLEKELEEKEKRDKTEAAGIAFLDRKIILVKKPHISHVPFYGFSRVLLHELSHLWLTNPYNSDSYIIDKWKKRFGLYKYPDTEDRIAEINTSWISDSKGYIKFLEEKSTTSREEALFIISLHLHNGYLRIYKGWKQYSEVRELNRYEIRKGKLAGTRREIYNNIQNLSRLIKTKVIFFLGEEVKVYPKGFKLALQRLSHNKIPVVLAKSDEEREELVRLIYIDLDIPIENFRVMTYEEAGIDLDKVDSYKMQILGIDDLHCIPLTPTKLKLHPELKEAEKNV